MLKSFENYLAALRAYWNGISASNSSNVATEVNSKASRSNSASARFFAHDVTTGTPEAHSKNCSSDSWVAAWLPDILTHLLQRFCIIQDPERTEQEAQAKRKELEGLLDAAIEEIQQDVQFGFVNPKFTAFTQFCKEFEAARDKYPKLKLDKERFIAECIQRKTPVEQYALSILFRKRGDEQLADSREHIKERLGKEGLTVFELFRKMALTGGVLLDVKGMDKEEVKRWSAQLQASQMAVRVEKLAKNPATAAVARQLSALVAAPCLASGTTASKILTELRTLLDDKCATRDAIIKKFDTLSETLRREIPSMSESGVVERSEYGLVKQGLVDFTEDQQATLFKHLPLEKLLALIGDEGRSLEDCGQFAELVSGIRKVDSAIGVEIKNRLSDFEKVVAAFERINANAVASVAYVVEAYDLYSELKQNFERLPSPTLEGMRIVPANLLFDKFEERFKALIPRNLVLNRASDKALGRLNRIATEIFEITALKEAIANEIDIRLAYINKSYSKILANYFERLSGTEVDVTEFLKAAFDLHYFENEVVFTKHNIFRGSFGGEAMFELRQKLLFDYIKRQIKSNRGDGERKLRNVHKFLHSREFKHVEALIEGLDSCRFRSRQFASHVEKYTKIKGEWQAMIIRVFTSMVSDIDVICKELQINVEAYPQTDLATTPDSVRHAFRRSLYLNAQVVGGQPYLEMRQKA